MRYRALVWSLIFVAIAAANYEDVLDNPFLKSEATHLSTGHSIKDVKLHALPEPPKVARAPVKLAPSDSPAASNEAVHSKVASPAASVGALSLIEQRVKAKESEIKAAAEEEFKREMAKIREEARQLSISRGGVSLLAKQTTETHHSASDKGKLRMESSVEAEIAQTPPTASRPPLSFHYKPFHDTVYEEQPSSLISMSEEAHRQVDGTVTPRQLYGARASTTVPATVLTRLRAPRGPRPSTTSAPATRAPPGAEVAPATSRPVRKNRNEVSEDDLMREIDAAEAAAAKARLTFAASHGHHRTRAGPAGARISAATNRRPSSAVDDLSSEDTESFFSAWGNAPKRASAAVTQTLPPPSQSAAPALSVAQMPIEGGSPAPVVGGASSLLELGTTSTAEAAVAATAAATAKGGLGSAKTGASGRAVGYLLPSMTGASHPGAGASVEHLSARSFLDANGVVQNQGRNGAGANAQLGGNAPLGGNAQHGGNMQFGGNMPFGGNAQHSGSTGALADHMALTSQNFDRQFEQLNSRSAGMADTKRNGAYSAADVTSANGPRSRRARDGSAISQQQQREYASLSQISSEKIFPTSSLPSYPSFLQLGSTIRSQHHLGMRSGAAINTKSRAKVGNLAPVAPQSPGWPYVNPSAVGSSYVLNSNMRSDLNTFEGSHGYSVTTRPGSLRDHATGPLGGGLPRDTLFEVASGTIADSDYLVRAPDSPGTFQSSPSNPNVMRDGVGLGPVPMSHFPGASSYGATFSQSFASPNGAAQGMGAGALAQRGLMQSGMLQGGMMQGGMVQGGMVQGGPASQNGLSGMQATPIGISGVASPYGNGFTAGPVSDGGPGWQPMNSMTIAATEARMAPAPLEPGYLNSIPANGAPFPDTSLIEQRVLNGWSRNDQFIPGNGAPGPQPMQTNPMYGPISPGSTTPSTYASAAPSVPQVPVSYEAISASGNAMWPSAASAGAAAVVNGFDSLVNGGANLAGIPQGNKASGMPIFPSLQPPPLSPSDQPISAAELTKQGTPLQWLGHAQTPASVGQAVALMGLVGPPNDAAAGYFPQGGRIGDTSPMSMGAANDRASIGQAQQSGAWGMPLGVNGIQANALAPASAYLAAAAGGAGMSHGAIGSGGSGGVYGPNMNGDTLVPPLAEIVSGVGAAGAAAVAWSGIRSENTLREVQYPADTPFAAADAVGPTATEMALPPAPIDQPVPMGGGVLGGGMGTGVDGVMAAMGLPMGSMMTS